MDCLGAKKGEMLREYQTRGSVRARVSLVENPSCGPSADGGTGRPLACSAGSRVPLRFAVDLFRQHRTLWHFPCAAGKAPQSCTYSSDLSGQGLPSAPVGDVGRNSRSRERVEGPWPAVVRETGVCKNVRECLPRTKRLTDGCDTSAAAMMGWGDPAANPVSTRRYNGRQWLT